MQPASPLLALQNVSKRYGGVTPCSDVDFSCNRGAIHAILGENGAGKSTLIKIMAGVVQPDEGADDLRRARRRASPTRPRLTGPASSASSRNCR